jgi:hypothetical protein
VNIRDVVAQQFLLTPAGTPPYIDIREARVKAARCVTVALEEACKRRCSHCNDNVAARPSEDGWSHAGDACDASDLRDFLAELQQGEPALHASR